MKKIFGVCYCLVGMIIPCVSFAANSVWNGTADSVWVNSANWSVSPYPSGADKATFNNAGNGNTTLDLSGLPSLLSIDFITGAGAYTIGSGGVNNQTLKLRNNGYVTLFASATNSQLFNAKIDLGSDTTAATTTYFVNDTAGYNITLAGDITSSVAGAKRLQLQGFSGTGVVSGVFSDFDATSKNNLYKNGRGTWRVTGNNSFKGDVNINQGVLIIDNSNALGTGAKTVTVTAGTSGNPQLHLDGSAGSITLETNITFSTSCDTDGVVINIAGTNTVKGNFSFNSGGGGTTITSRKDKLILTGNFQAATTGRALSLRGDGDGEISGVIANGGTPNMPINRNLGSGTWTLTGSNTFSGSTFVSFGKLVVRGPNGALSGGVNTSLSGTFELVNSAVENNTNRLPDTATITLSGGTFGFIHDGGDADYAETVGLLAVTGARTTVITSQASENHTSTLTFAALSRKGGVIEFTGPGLGTNAQNRIFITAQPEGLIGSWATVTTESGTFLASYSLTDGVYASTQKLDDVSVKIDAFGPGSLIPDNTNSVVRITTAAGTEGPILLDGLTGAGVSWIEQDNVTNALINTYSNAAPQTLKTAALIINEDKGSLTVGDTPNNGKLTALNAADSLVLVNSSTNGQLVVNASILNNGASTILYKYGEGATILKGTNNYAGLTTVHSGELIYASSQNQTFSGGFNNYGTLTFSNSAPLTTIGTIINHGQLVFAGTAITTNKVTGSVGGVGSLIKNDPGVLHLMNQCAYSGPTYINAGTVRVNDNTAFGPDNAGTFIANGATFAVGATADVGGSIGKDALNLQTERFYVSGSGVDGKGVLVNDSTNSQVNVLGMITMQGDSTIGGISRFDVRNQTLIMNGYTFTKKGTNDLALISEHVVPGATGRINVDMGMLRLQDNTMMNGSPANVFTVNTGTTLDLYSLLNPVDWSMSVSNGATLRAGNSTATTQNTWNGPVALDGLINFTSPGGAYYMTLTNQVSGNATVIKSGNVRSVLSLTAPLNTYSGNTIISNGVLYAKYPGSLPGASTGKVSIPASSGNIGTIGVAVDNGTYGWTSDEIRDMLAATPYTTMYASLWFDAAADYDYPYSVPSPIGLWKTGAGRLLLSAPQTFTGELRVNGGGLTLTNNVFVYTTNINAYVAENAGDQAELTLAGTAKVTSTLPATSGATSLISVGNTGKGVVTLKDQAILTGKLYMGNNAGGTGAVYQAGSSTVTNWCGTGQDARWGYNGYGYYELSGGSLVNMGYHQLGVNAGSAGIFVQKGGSFEQLSATGFNGRLALSRGGTGIVYTEGGTFTSVPFVYVGGDSSSISGGVGAFTVDGTSQVTIQSYLEICYAATITFTRTGYFNLNGGLFSANTISKGTIPTNTQAYVGFDGGTYKARQHGTLIASGNASPDMVTVYEGGLTVDTAGYNTAIPVPLRAPAGSGISDITLNNAGADYIGPPVVTLTGGGGAGASAIALFDSTTRTLTEIRVTSPGFGYTSAPAVTLAGGGGTGAVATASIAANISGGLVKTGAGTLSLSGGSSYKGETDVNQGTLILSSPNALTTGAVINVANGATVKMSAGSRQLAHRWSFNGDYSDSIGGATATASSNALGKITLSSTDVRLEGGAKGTSAILLPANLLPHANAPVTIELWAKTHMTNTWSRIFDFGSSTTSYMLMTWTQGLAIGNDRVEVRWGADPNFTQANTTMAPYVLNQDYHIAFVVTPYGGTNNTTLIQWVRHNLTTGEKKRGSMSTPWTLASLVENNMYLGRSQFGDNDAAATYNEVRIWNSALPELQLDENAILGPDTLPVDVKDDYQVNLSSGSTLDLLGGSSEVRTITGTGLVTNGTLVVTGKLLVDATAVGSNSLTLEGNLTFADGATIEVVNPGLLVPGRAYIVARAGSISGTINWTNPPNPDWVAKNVAGQLRLYCLNTVILFR